MASSVIISYPGPPGVHTRQFCCPSSWSSRGRKSSTLTRARGGSPAPDDLGITRAPGVRCILFGLWCARAEQKQTAKVTAMQPLSAVLPGVCAKFRPALDPASVRLTLNKKPVSGVQQQHVMVPQHCTRSHSPRKLSGAAQVDVDVPFRLANIPSGSILVVSSSRPAAAAPPPQPAAAAATAGTDAAEAAPPATAAPAPIPTPVPPPSAEAPQPPTLPSPIHPTAQPQEAQPVAATEQQQPALAPPPQQPTLAPAPQQHVPSPPAAPLVDLLQLSTAAGLSPPREALLTTEAALQQQQHRRLHQHDAPGGAGASSGGGAMEVRVLSLTSGAAPHTHTARCARTWSPRLVHCPVRAGGGRGQRRGRRLLRADARGPGGHVQGAGGAAQGARPTSRLGARLAPTE